MEEQRGIYLVNSLDSTIQAKKDLFYFHCNSLGDLYIPTNDEIRSAISSSSSTSSLATDSKLNRQLIIPSSSSSKTIPKRPIKSIPAKEINKSLNLYLGLPFNPRNIKLIRFLCNILNAFITLFEKFAVESFWETLPLRLRQKITLLCWSLYLPLHKLVLSNKTGIHVNASLEYHALTTILYWGRLFPTTVQRMRYSLRNINVLHAPKIYPCLKSDREATVTTVHHYCTKESTLHVVAKTSQRRRIIHRNNNAVTLTGQYIQHDTAPSQKIIMYLYGGAFLSGDTNGNLKFAEKMGQSCGGMDLFLPEYRLVPEHDFLDALHDVIHAYEYLVLTRNISPKNIFLFGLSSGGGLQVRLLQTIVKRNCLVTDTEDDEFLLQSMPRGAVLMCPFVDYTEPKGSFVEYKAHDLVVNEGVFETGLQHLQHAGTNEERKELSPVHLSLEGLPPLCVLISQHECLYDQVKLFCNRARSDGVLVDVGVWNYLCHVWPVFTAFLPEARQAVQFMCNWINNRNTER